MECTIYLPDPSILTSKFFERYRDDHLEAFVGLESGGRPVGVEFVLDVGTVQMHFLGPEETTAHLKGLQTLIEAEVGEGSRRYALNRVSNIRAVLGCVIETSDEQTAREFLMNFTMDACGMALFSPRDLMDFDGEFLTG